MSEEEQIHQILSKVATAWYLGKIELIMENYCPGDSTMLQPSGGDPVFGLDQIREAYETLVGVSQIIISAEHIDIISPEFAHVTCSYYIQPTREGIMRGIPEKHSMFTWLMKKVKGRWLVLKDHSS